MRNLRQVDEEFPDAGHKGFQNLAYRLPEEYLPSDLGPKLFINYGFVEQCRFGKTNLHRDITDVVNVMYNVDDKTSNQKPVAAALWHIFPYECMRPLGEYISLVKDMGSPHPILDRGLCLDEEETDRLRRQQRRPRRLFKVIRRK